MAIKIRCDLQPHSFRAKGHALADIDIHSWPDGTRHGYSVTFGNTYLTGSIPKTRSGHRNILHVLKAVLADMDLDALGADYIETPKAAKAR